MIKKEVKSINFLVYKSICKRYFSENNVLFLLCQVSELEMYLDRTKFELKPT